jgi:hypothetical protein
MPTTTQASRRAPDFQRHPLPVMRVTSFDRVSSFMMSAVLAAIVTVIAIVCWWYATRPATVPVLQPLELVAAGGYEDGSPDETLNVESPEEENPFASPVEEQMDEQQIEEVLDAVVELSDRASEQVQQVLAQDAATGGVPGSYRGTGGRPLGEGGGAGGGVARENRWFVKFADQESLEEYSKQLDFFGIELGVAYPQRSELVYVSKFSQATPAKRVVKTGKGEMRLYMTWQGGQRKAADIKLLAKAGVDPSGGIMLQFYPAQTEQLLAQAERSYANRPEREIRRTYFVIVPRGRGYSFAVTQQTYFR